MQISSHIINLFSTVAQRCSTLVHVINLYICNGCATVRTYVERWLNTMITVKQYAEQVGKTHQSVYKQIKAKKNQERLQGHIIKQDGTTYLDDIAVDILNESRSTPIVVIEQNSSNELEQLKLEKEQMLFKITNLQDQLLTEKDKVIALQNEKKLIAEQTSNQIKSAEDTLKNELQAQFNEQLQSLKEDYQRQLDAEKRRKLTFKERLFGSKV